MLLTNPFSWFLLLYSSDLVCVMMYMFVLLLVMLFIIVTEILCFVYFQISSDYEFDLNLYESSIPWLSCPEGKVYSCYHGDDEASFSLVNLKYCEIISSVYFF